MFRRILIITVVLLSLAGTAEAGKKAESDDGVHRVMTCNIRITGLEADAPYPERVWENRRDLCVETILSRRPDIICLQEVIYDSYAYLKEKLRGYVPYGFAGPEMDPYTEGYHFIGKNVIFFRRDRYEFVSAGCYWLSETPLIGGSCSWNTTRARPLQLGAAARQTFGPRAARAGRAPRPQERRGAPRADPDGDGRVRAVRPRFPADSLRRFQRGYRQRADRLHPHGRRLARDVRERPRPGETGFTAHAFKGEEYKPEKSHRIDFIFYRGDVEVCDAEIVRDRKGAMYPSDHYFLFSEFTLR